MTNQNVMVPDVKSRIGVAIAVAMSKSGLLSGPPVPESWAALGGFLAISQKRLIKRLEYGGGGGGGAKVSAWIDSMRASSPPRTKSTIHTTDMNENHSWIFHHPPALSKFDQIRKEMKGKQVVMFLDYDGTLSPIVSDPDRAFMTKKMRAAVKDIARHFPTAIVSGRCKDKVFNFVKLAELYYAGSHGMYIQGPTKYEHHHRKVNQRVLFQPADEFLPMIDEVYKVLFEKTKSVPGAYVENNKYCLSVHFRCVDEKSWASLAEQVRSVLNDYPKLRLTQGRKVLEIRPTIKWDKGKALEFLLESLGYANSNDVFPIYIGDDQTDEDAFKVLRNRGQGIGILVSKIPKETQASYTLQDPSEVELFLRRMVQAETVERNSIKNSREILANDLGLN